MTTPEKRAAALAKQFNIDPSACDSMVRAARAAAALATDLEPLADLAVRQAAQVRARPDRESKGLDADGRKVVDEMIRWLTR